MTPLTYQWTAKYFSIDSALSWCIPILIEKSEMFHTLEIHLIILGPAHYDASSFAGFTYPFI